jgi:hypothetical protein
MRVSNMASSNGNTVANQFIVNDDNGNTFFQSYDSIIVKISKGKISLDSHYWDYSKTTGKYRNQFLNEDKKETQKKIDSGEYELTDLN